MRASLLFLVALLTALNTYSQVTGDSKRKQKVVDTSGGTNSQVAQALLNDINTAFAAMEQDIERAYAKLKKELKDNIELNYNKIKQFDQQIENLKKEVKELEMAAQGKEKLLDSLINRKNIPNIPLAEKESLTQQLAVVQQQLLKTQEDIKNIDKQIHELRNEIKQLKEDIQNLEAKIAQLEKDKQKAIHEVAKQKQKAIREVEKRYHESNYKNTLALQLKNISQGFKDTIRATELRYRRIR